MSDNLILIAVIAGAAALAVFSLSVVDQVAKEEKSIEKSLDKPGSVPIYGKCKRASECQGGTNWGTFGNLVNCDGGVCVPMVKRDDGFAVRYTPSELGLKKACGKYWLLGDGMPCNKTSECGTNYLTTDAADDSNLSATGTSKTFCGDGLCRVKGKDIIGIYYEPSDKRVKNVPLTYDQGVATGEIFRKNRESAKVTCPQLL